MSKDKHKSRILFDQHMIEFCRKKFHEVNWTEPLRNVAGDCLRRNSFMIILSNAMLLKNASILEQINVQYQDDISIGRSTKREQLVEFF